MPAILKERWRETLSSAPRRLVADDVGTTFGFLVEGRIGTRSVCTVCAVCNALRAFDLTVHQRSPRGAAYSRSQAEPASRHANVRLLLFSGGLRGLRLGGLSSGLLLRRRLLRRRLLGSGFLCSSHRSISFAVATFRSVYPRAVYRARRRAARPPYGSPCPPHEECRDERDALDTAVVYGCMCCMRCIPTLNRKPLQMLYSTFECPFFSKIREKMQEFSLGCAVVPR